MGTKVILSSCHSFPCPHRNWPSHPETQARASLPWCVAVSVRHLTDTMRCTIKGRRFADGSSVAGCLLLLMSAGWFVQEAVAYPGMREAASTFLSASEGLPTPPSASLAA